MQPGITWEQLDRALKPHGLTLRLYPTSYPSSSVGGWLSQGGAGIGSYRYGYFADNVVSAKAVLPNGDVRVFAGDDLALLAGAEGITGFLSEVTLRVMPVWEPHLVAIACTKALGLQRIIEEIEAADLPIWSMCFINPRMAELKNEAPVRMHNGHPVEKHVELPKAYILTMCCDVKDTEAVEAGVAEILAAHEATRLNDEIAQHEPLIAGALTAVGILIIYAGLREEKQPRHLEIQPQHSLWIGLVQGLCLPFRGFSRSGATISTGLLLGLPKQKLEEFSFALAVVLTPPVIAQEAHRLIKAHALSGQNSVLHLFVPGLVGMGLSFVAGLLALKLLSRWLEGGRWKFFGFYCLIAAAGVLLIHFKVK